VNYFLPIIVYNMPKKSKKVPKAKSCNTTDSSNTKTDSSSIQYQTYTDHTEGDSDVEILDDAVTNKDEVFLGSTHAEIVGLRYYSGLVTKQEIV